MPYHSYSDVLSHFHHLESQYPSLCRYMSIGTTVEGREIPCLIVGNGTGYVLMEGAPHGDEWSAAEMVYMWADYLVNNQNDSIVKQILQGTKQYCIPMMSPDGHEAHTRKNANGVDCNRNFDSDWCGCGSSTQPSSPIYKGPYAFSEPETQAYRDLLNSVPFKRAISWHSGTELLMYPWGYTYNPAPDKAYFQDICDQVNDEIIRRGHSSYRAGQISTEYPPETLEYPDEATLERDIEILMENRSGAHIIRLPVRTGPKELTIYCASGTTVDYYYMHNTFAWVLEVSYSKTPPYSSIPGYFERQLPLQIIVSLDACEEPEPTGPVDDTKYFNIAVW